MTTLRDVALMDLMWNDYDSLSRVKFLNYLMPRVSFCGFQAKGIPSML